MKKMIALSGLLVLLMAAPALAHFQMIYTPEIALMKGGTIDFKLVFTHPFSAGHTMDMGKPEQFYVLYSKGETPAKNRPGRLSQTHRMDEPGTQGPGL